MHHQTHQNGVIIRNMLIKPVRFFHPGCESATISELLEAACAQKAQFHREGEEERGRLREERETD